LIKEVAVERYGFTCAGCGHAWSTDYDVQHVEDGHGLTWEYYSLDGIPVLSPTAPGTLSCPRCGATWIHVDLVAVRTVPLAESPHGEADPARPRQRLDADRQAAREQAGLLRSDEPGTHPPGRSGRGAAGP
jgi:hypothetical protein